MGNNMLFEKHYNAIIIEIYSFYCITFNYVILNVSRGIGPWQHSFYTLEYIRVPFCTVM